MRVEWVVVLCAVVGCGSAEPEEDRPRRCERLRDHLVDLRLATASGLTRAEIEQHRVTMQTSLDARFIASCAERMTDEQLACALRADNAQAASACTSTPTSH
jgi:hypothetical protein